MRLFRLALGLALAGLAGCDAPAGHLDGHWGWQYNGNPGGSYVTLTLVTAGSSVTGTGSVCGIGPSCTPGSVAITGSFVRPYGAFALTLTGAGGYEATYTGTVVGADQLQGTWTVGTQSGPSTFYRCTPSSIC